jgi:hypothetical protein
MILHSLSRVGAFVVVVSLITALSACEKYVDDGPCYFEGCLDCCAENPRQEFINWYFYDVGSYHIYENQLTGQVDTVLVTDFVVGYDHNGYFGFFSWAEIINRNQYVSILFSEKMETFSRTNPNYSNIIAAVHHGEFDNPGAIQNDALLFPLYVGNKRIAHYDSPVEIVAIYPKIFIGGNEYQNVAEIDVINDYTEFGHHSRYFVAKHIGIVRRMDLDTGDDWQLTEYAVFQ